MRRAAIAVVVAALAVLSGRPRSRRRGRDRSGTAPGRRHRRPARPHVPPRRRRRSEARRLHPRRRRHTAGRHGDLRRGLDPRQQGAVRALRPPARRAGLRHVRDELPARAVPSLPRRGRRRAGERGVGARPRVRLRSRSGPHRRDRRLRRRAPLGHARHPGRGPARPRLARLGRGVVGGPDGPPPGRVRAGLADLPRRVPELHRAAVRRVDCRRRFADLARRPE